MQGRAAAPQHPHPHPPPATAELRGSETAARDPQAPSRPRVSPHPRPPPRTPRRRRCPRPRGPPAGLSVTGDRSGGGARGDRGALGAALPCGKAAPSLCKTLRWQRAAPFPARPPLGSFSWKQTKRDLTPVVPTGRA